MNFERSENPLKSLDIGVKIYRCGYCGNPTTFNGIPLASDSDEYKEAIEVINKIGDDKTELVVGDCCAEKHMQLTQMRVTHDMAMDAGDMSLEGTFI
jgi:hypothetical protein